MFKKLISIFIIAACLLAYGCGTEQEGASSDTETIPSLAESSQPVLDESGGEESDPSSNIVLDTSEASVDEPYAPDESPEPEESSKIEEASESDKPLKPVESSEPAETSTPDKQPEQPVVKTASTGLHMTYIDPSWGGGSGEPFWRVDGIGSCTDTDIVIPSTREGHPVTVINGKAFANNAKIVSVTMPKNLHTIDEEAFANCVNLKTVVMPEGPVDILPKAFDNCASLSRFDFEPVAILELFAFRNCASLTEVHFSDKLANFNNSAFAGCKSLVKATVAKENPIFKSSGNCIYDPESKSLCFATKNCVIPSDGSVEIIDGAFCYNNAIDTVVIPSTIKTIGYEAFANSSIKSLTVPSSVTVIESNAFENCTKLETIVLPERMESIGFYAFAGCTKLKSIRVPEGIIQICAFKNCSSLTSIVLPESLRIIDFECFEGCKSLSSIELPQSLRFIAAAFKDCASLTEVRVPARCSRLDLNSFYGCSKLQKLYLGRTDYTVNANESFELDLSNPDACAKFLRENDISGSLLIESELDFYS